MRIAVALVLLLAAHAAAAQPADLRFTPVAEIQGLTDIVNAGDGSNRLFLVQQIGIVRVLQGGTLAATPFLDIRGRVNANAEEQGLLSLAFAPNLAQSRRLYVWYTRADGDTVLSRFAVNPGLQSADPASEQVLLVVDQPFDNHNGGKLAFGPDGYLYLSTGDGGGGGDPLNAGQNPGQLLGKILRLDTESGASPYAIPPGNPYIGQPGRDEVWAIGLRNPWRIAFDPANGDLFIADVGQGMREEVNIQPAGVGGLNYGWRFFEGTLCFSPPCPSGDFVAPVAQYPHSVGCSITGGHVYRGSKYPNMNGTYFYGDFCSGVIFGLTRAGGSFNNQQLRDTDFGITTFGVDEVGDIYVFDYLTATVYLLSDGPPVNSLPITGAFTGTWYDPEQSGHGLFIEVLQDGRMVVAWFTFRPEGGQAWLFAQGDIQGDRAVLTTFIPSGARFIPNFDPADVQLVNWGTLTISFSDCRNGLVEYASTTSFGSGSMRLVRLTDVAGIACP